MTLSILTNMGLADDNPISEVRRQMMIGMNTELIKLVDEKLAAAEVRANFFKHLLDKYLVEVQQFCRGDQIKSLKKDGLLALNHLLNDDDDFDLGRMLGHPGGGITYLLDEKKTYFPADLLNQTLDYNSRHCNTDPHNLAYNDDECLINFAIDSRRIATSTSNALNLKVLLKWMLKRVNLCENGCIELWKIGAIHPSCSSCAKVERVLIRSRLYRDLLLLPSSAETVVTSEPLNHTLKRFTELVVRVIGLKVIQPLLYADDRTTSAVSDRYRQAFVKVETELQQIMNVLTHPCHAVELPDCLAQLTIEYI
jgi:hypothetical protein